MENEPSPTPPSEPVAGPNAGSSGGGSRSTIAGVVVVVVLLGFAGLLFMANFQGAVHTDGPGKAPLQARGKQPAKGKPAKGKAKGKSKSKVTKVPVDRLLIEAPPFERPTAPAGAHNVVVVIPTAVRKDHLTPYGADEKLTPYLGTLAATGARFADAISAGPFSRYATIAAFTGQYPAALGVVEPGSAPDLRVLPESVETMTEVFRKSGWRTYGVTANFNLNSSSGFAQGFDVYRDAQPSGFAPDARLEGPAAAAVALQLLKNRSGEDQARPFFLMVDLVDAHPPQRPVKEVMDQFDPKAPNAVYRTAVHRVDEYVQDLADGLTDLGYDTKNTYFVVVGDHGEGLEDPPHHGKVHGKYLYETSVAIPWIVAGPDIPANRVITGLAGSTDVMPTLLGLVGLKAPEGIDGRSWADPLKGGDAKTTRETAISDTWYFDANRSSIWTSSLQCQKDFGTPPFDQDTFVDGCFDRKIDPTFKEVKPLDPLMAQLEKWRADVTPKVMEIPPIDESRGKAPAGKPEGKAGKGPGKAPSKAPNQEG